jgi:type I restriction enzyme M protein
MIALPRQLFFNAQIPACLWFLTKQKTIRKGEVLFIDARKLGSMISRSQLELTDADIQKIADVVHAWRADGEISADYADILGFCRSVPLAEIAEHGHVLTPGRYVGAEAVEDDDERVVIQKNSLLIKYSTQIHSD